MLLLTRVNIHRIAAGTNAQVGGRGWRYQFFPGYSQKQRAARGVNLDLSCHPSILMPAI
jgi:hypothetical protein